MCNPYHSLSLYSTCLFLPFRLLRRSQSPEGQSFRLTAREVKSVQFIQQVLLEWDSSLSGALGDLLSRLSNSGRGGGKGLHRSVSSSSASASASATSSDEPAAASDQTMGVSGGNSKECSVNEPEKCTVCGGCMLYRAPVDMEAAVTTSSCADCTTLFDRCCVSFVTVGFDSLISGNVLRCTICSSVGLVQQPEDNKGNIVRDTEEDIPTEGEYIGSNIEFEWGWWNGRGPSCPYCGVLMLPLV